MHYYKRNIGDYHKKAGRLSILEHGAYTLLMDACYDREQFPTKDQAVEWTWARSPDEIAAVEFVLSRFFTFQDGVYVQPEIKAGIADYYEAKKKHWGAKLSKAERAYIQANRNARKLRATPPWLSKEHKLEIKAIYREAAQDSKQTGIPHEVDHEVPLRGINVCGLHVPWNLRVIPAWRNRQKSNKWEAQ